VVRKIFASRRRNWALLVPIAPILSRIAGPPSAKSLDNALFSSDSTALANFTGRIGFKGSTGCSGMPLLNQRYARTVRY
jgi:hypothetical protein